MRRYLTRRLALFAVALTFAIVSSVAVAQERTGPTKVTIDPATNVLVINGQKVFPIAFTLPPPFAKPSPRGTHSYQELYDAGASFIRSGPHLGQSWDEQWFEYETGMMDAAAKYGLYCAPWLKEASGVENEKQEALLRKIVSTFKDHPGLGVWKGEDEPEWGKKPVEPLVRTRKIIEEMDGNHPIWIVQAPRGTVESLKSYDPTYDITGVDVYPIGYPPGEHSLLPNNDISVVGDHLNIMQQVAGGKPVWATLQISWSGVVKPGRTLRMPTFFEQRYMTYQSIALGARGLVYFGGHNEAAMPPRDKELGWNWTFFDKMMRPMLEEVGRNSPLYPALLAPESKIPITAPDVEMCVREVGDEIFVVATYRNGETKQIRFLGLPEGLNEEVEVMFESPRTVKIEQVARNENKPDVKVPSFQDWFGPHDVHVYRLTRK